MAFMIKVIVEAEAIVLMGLVDSHYRFVWGSCGFPGNSHDAVIFVQQTSGTR